MSGVGHECFLGWGGHGKLSLGQGVNNLHTLAIEKKAQRKTRMINLKHNIKFI
jgi:hypothetical protein